ncbi:glycosyltransferase [Acidihalobacter ferrooxydans]|uniref:Glycosyl transferase family 1 domain-containing protein n=1 Tax=Acidihalobacter ferrooxydans TaxID=1765967 RepID=A0A1P8UI07_9GAMM|nr:glycosyltransferase [Acidihalobacter ferrooxydans]APZ43466.1 hypothetical protein BW247_10510 [Acidihalobacter ferrooxydans]
MKVCFFNFSDNRHGDGTTASMMTLTDSLQAQGVGVNILCLNKSSHEDNVFSLPPLSNTEHILRFFTRRMGLNDIHHLSSFHVERLAAYREADIAHFYGIHSGTLSYLALPKLTRSKPAFFALPDMWSMTGHCTFPGDSKLGECRKWETGCGSCPDLSIHVPVWRDGTWLDWRLKKRVWDRSDIQFIAPSVWMQKQAQRSMLREHIIHHIPRSLDVNAYKPYPRKQARELLGIDFERKVIMAMASDFRRQQKGMDLLVQSLNALPPDVRSAATLLCIGNGGENLAEACEMDVLSLGVVSNERLKAICYSAADVFVLPSRSESFGRVNMESLACGTPVVAFDVGGVSDVVRPGVSGILAKPNDPKDLSEKILHLLEDDSLRAGMAKNCRAIAVEEYDKSVEARRYIELYEQALT